MTFIVTKQEINLNQNKNKDDTLVKLKAAIQVGLDSGISDRSFEEITQSVEDRLRENGKL